MDNLLKMAQQAGFGEMLPNQDGLSSSWVGFNTTSIKHFAKLVAKAKAEQLATALELGPVNDTAASIAIWIRQQ